MSKELNPEYDKSRWMVGPWNNEPDKVEFEHAGFKCLILRHLMGHLNGYVGVPSTHPAYEKDYDDVDLHVHGGVTYASFMHLSDELWWFGFDTAHHMDLSPDMFRYYVEDGSTYKDVDYVRKETEQLAEQLATQSTTNNNDTTGE